MMMMRELPRVGGVAVQGEDEIASIGMCIGAVMAGARALTATSGPGISLYSENLGLAIMGEVPLVVVDVQRLGPATGGATTVGQGDVQFVRWGTSGGYPIIALAPSSIPDCYHLTMRAFDLAERFRCPVFLLTDKELNMTMNTVAVGDYVPAEVRPRPLPEGPGKPYRYQPADQVPPLRQYGAGETVRFTGSSHDERAFISKHPATVDALNRHLAAKIDDHRDEIDLVEADLEPGRRTLVVSYGVTAGAVREAVRRARRAGPPAVVAGVQEPVAGARGRAAIGGGGRGTGAGPRTEPGPVPPRGGAAAPGHARGRAEPGGRRDDHPRADPGSGEMTTTITPLATYRNDLPYPFCPGCGHSPILDALNAALGAPRDGPGQRGHRERHRLQRPQRPVLRHQRLPRPARAKHHLRHRHQAGPARPRRRGGHGRRRAPASAAPTCSTPPGATSGSRCWSSTTSTSA